MPNLISIDGKNINPKNISFVEPFEHKLCFCCMPVSTSDYKLVIYFNIEYPSLTVSFSNKKERDEAVDYLHNLMLES